MPQPRSTAWPAAGIGQELQQEPGADIQPGAGKNRAAGAHGQSQFAVDVFDRVRRRAGNGPRVAGQQDPGFLPGKLGLDFAEAALQHRVHAQTHVLHPAACQQDDVGGGVAGDGVGDFLQLRQGLGQLEEHHIRPGQQPGPERVLFEAAGNARRPCVVAKGLFPGDEVLVRSDGAVPAAGGVVESQGTERQGTVAVPHDGEPAAGVQGSGREHVRGGVQEELVRGVPGLQVGRLHIREPAQPGEEGVKIVVRHARAAAFCESRVGWLRMFRHRGLRSPANLSCSPNKRRMPATAARPARFAPIVDEDGP